MFESRFSRMLAVGVLAGSAALATVPLAGSAFASTPGIKCKQVTGNIADNITLSRCSGNTGGASQAIPVALLSGGGGTITWLNGKTTTVTVKVAVGVENDTGELQDCPVTSLEAEVKGRVTADTTGSLTVGTKLKTEACVDNNTGEITLEPGTKVIFKATP